MTSRCFIALGGNLGDVPARFEDCLAALQHTDGIDFLRLSPIYRSEPMGASAGTTFWNAAAELDCALEPHEFLRLLQEIEIRFGRERGVRWGPRTIDLDILLLGDQIIRTPTLEVPHPGMFYRRFVLDPLCDIAAAVHHPICGLSLSDLRSRLLERPLPIAIDVAQTEQRDQIVETLTTRFPEIHVVDDPDENSALVLFADESNVRISLSTCQVDLRKINSDLTAAAIDVLTAALG